MAEERTAGGRLFHALGSATANARSPIFDRRVAGMTRSLDDADRVLNNNIFCIHIIIVYLVRYLHNAHVYNIMCVCVCVC